MELVTLNALQTISLVQEQMNVLHVMELNVLLVIAQALNIKGDAMKNAQPDFIASPSNQIRAVESVQATVKPVKTHQSNAQAVPKDTLSMKITIVSSNQ